MNKKVVLIILMLVLVIIVSIVAVILNKISNSTTTTIEENTNKKENFATENDSENIEENPVTENNNENIEGKDQDNKVEEIRIKVNSEILNMKLEKNEATKALVEKLKQGDIVVNTSEYGSFEQVGNLGFSLPRNDTQIKTKVGDVMLYQGNQISIFYGSNSWSYTKLGEITNKTESELKNILETSNATLVLSIN